MSAPDGGVLLVGGSGSGRSGNKTLPSYGGDDFWVVKLAGPPPPRLAIEQSAGGVRVSWPLSATGYALEQTGALESPPAATIWSQVPFPYEINATHNFITVPMPAGNTFYRLRKP